MADEGSRGLGRAVYAGFLFCVLLTLVFMLGVVTIQSDSGPLTITKLVVGAGLAVEGFLLLENWGGARTQLIRHLRAKRGSSGRSLVWFTTGKAMGLLGLLWVCMGAFALALGISGLV